MMSLTLGNTTFYFRTENNDFFLTIGNTQQISNAYIPNVGYLYVHISTDPCKFRAPALKLLLYD